MGIHTPPSIQIIKNAKDETTEDGIPKLKEYIKSYILQIDRTMDSSYSMIGTVRDTVSGFVLYAKKCYSESENAIKEIFLTVRGKFGIPSGIISDMSSGILSTADKVYSGICRIIARKHWRISGRYLIHNGNSLRQWQ